MSLSDIGLFSTSTCFFVEWTWRKTTVYASYGMESESASISAS